MAERLKEFFNGTLTSADLVNGDEWVLIQNDATTQAVVKDVLVDSSVVPTDVSGNIVACDLMNGDFKIGEKVSMSGHEIVEKGQTLKYKLPNEIKTDTLYYSPPAVARESIIQSTTKVYTKVLNNHVWIDKTGTFEFVPPLDADLVRKYFNSGFSGTANELVFDLYPTAIPAMSEPAWFFATENYAYYFYYNGNDITYLYRAPVTGGVVGSWVSVDTSIHAYKAYDIENNAVWWVYGDILYRHDCATGTTTNVGTFSGVAPANTSSYTCAGVANGLFVYVISSSYVSVFYYYDSNTNTFGRLVCSAGFGVSIDSGLAVTYNPTEDRYYISVGHGSNVYTYAINNGFVSGNTITLLLSAQSFWPNGRSSTCSYIQGNAKGELFVRNGLDNAEKLYLENNSATSVNVHTDKAMLGDSGWFETIGAPQTATALLEEYNINLKCKVSGVEITEVV